MAKQLTAKVRLDTTNAEQALDRLANKIKSINRAISNTSNSNRAEESINRQAIAQERLRQATLRTQLAEERLEQARFRSAQMAANQIDREQAQRDRAAQREMANRERIQRQQDRLHQSQINDIANRMAQTERANQREIANQERIIRQAFLARQEWARCHPILNMLVIDSNRITDAFTRLNQTVNRFTNRTLNAFTQIRQRFNQFLSGHSRLNSLWTTGLQLARNIGNRILQWVNGIRQCTNANNGFNSSLRSTNSILGTINSKLVGLASTYLGILGTKSIINTSDAITSAQNKLNYVNSQSTGLEASDPQVMQMTQESLDKMYNSAQKVHMGYTDMMHSVSKNMALAGNAFDNNIDNAIRFQEVMAESYALGGASAQEMSSSMYQLSQALGSGILQGDELRSVREGAPLAYKAIEEFAQGVYNTTDSLKEMASQGMITSDMVVAAVMSAGNEMDKAFAQTAVRFSDAWTMIKNAATKAFEPVAIQLREMLNKALDNGMIEKFETGFYNIAKALQIVLRVIGNAFSWISENWQTVEGVIVAGLTTIGILMVFNAIRSAIAWLVANWALVLIASAIFVIIYLLYQWANGTIETTKLIEYAIIALGIIIMATIVRVTLTALVAAGVITAGVAWLIAFIMILIVVMIYFAFRYLEIFAGGVWVVLTFIGNLFQTLGNIIVTIVFFVVEIILNLLIVALNFIIWVINTVITMFWWGVATAYNLFVGFVNAIIESFFSIVDPIAGIIEWFVNAWNGAFTSVGGAFANFCGQLLAGLIGLVKPFAVLLDKIFGWNVEGMIASAQSGMRGWGKTSAAADFSIDRPSLKRISPSEMASEAFTPFEYISSTGGALTREGFDFFGTGLSDWSMGEAYQDGSNWGAGIKDSINDWGSNLGSDLLDKFSLDNIGEALGVDFGEKLSPTGVGNPNSLINPTAPDPLGGTGGGDGGSGGGSNPLGKIKKNTDDINDKLDLTEEDLAYLRKIAEMEWRKEYTTNTIKIDMTNNNTVNKDGDLDGIVTRLTAKLYEELNTLSNGVYA